MPRVRLCGYNRDARYREGGGHGWAEAGAGASGAGAAATVRVAVAEATGFDCDGVVRRRGGAGAAAGCNST
jgi:hypothetical protein